MTMLDIAIKNHILVFHDHDGLKEVLRIFEKKNEYRCQITFTETSKACLPVELKC